LSTLYVHVYAPPLQFTLMYMQCITQITLVIDISTDVDKIVVSPSAPSIISGGVMTMSGLNFTSNNHKIVCVFTDKDGDVTKDGQDSISGITVNGTAVCPMPLFRRLGTHNLTVPTNSKNFTATFNVGKETYYSSMYVLLCDTVKQCVRNEQCTNLCM